MTRYLIAAAGLVIAGAQLASAGSAAKSLGKIPTVNLPRPALEDSTPKIKPLPAKEWTVMVYMNGKNNVSSAADMNLNEMEAVGTTGNVNVVAEAGFLKGKTYSVARYVVEKDADPKKIGSQAVESFNFRDMGDYKNAIDFVKWAKTNFPAKHYMLAIWNHGTGFFDHKTAPAKAKSKGISFDDETGNYITTPQLRQILSAAGGVDVLAFNACLMSSAEVYEELNGQAKAVVASEDVMSAVGFDYASTIATLDANPGISPAQAANVVGAGYLERIKMVMKHGVSGGQITIVDPSKTTGLDAAIKAWTQTVISSKGDPAVMKAIQQALLQTPRYKTLLTDKDKQNITSFMGDLGVFVMLVNEGLKKADSPAAAAITASGSKLFASLKGMILAYDSVGGDDAGIPYEYSTGISVYLPPRLDTISQETLEGQAFAQEYAASAFAKSSGWGTFVKWLYSARPKITGNDAAPAAN
ncbi:MAG: hypothetical protein GX410_11360 [Elusimicrobia bacterium]|nr:hypothetical protein [Elusimicrobiota bacterium]